MDPCWIICVSSWTSSYVYKSVVVVVVVCTLLLHVVVDVAARCRRSRCFPPVVARGCLSDRACSMLSVNSLSLSVREVISARSPFPAAFNAVFLLADFVLVAYFSCFV